MDEVLKILDVHRIHSREKTGKREFKINTRSLLFRNFVSAHRHERRSVHLSKQTEFDCGGIAGVRANFKTRTNYPPTVYLPRNGNEQVANRRSASHWRNWKKRCRENGRCLLLCFSNGTRQYSNAKNVHLQRSPCNFLALRARFETIMSLLNDVPSFRWTISRATSNAKIDFSVML